jgi:hypothetical protein
MSLQGVFNPNKISGKSKVKSSYYSPHSKEPNPQQAEQGHVQMQQCV